MKLESTSFLEYLFYKLERGETLVFPTDSDKREFLYSYVEKKGKAVSGNAVLSYDEFRSSFIPYDSRCEVEFFEKVRFVQNLIDKNPTALMSLYNPTFSESKEQFAIDIAGKLKGLKALVEDEAVFSMLSQSLKKDISFLYQNYMDFINRNDLREPFFDTLDTELLSSNRNEFLLIVPELNPYYKNDQKFFEGCANIKKESFDSVSLPPIMKYDNIDEEIRGTLRSIRELLKNGVKPSDIRVTLLGSDEKAKSSFLQLSYLYDVPLQYTKNYSKEANNLYCFFKTIKVIVEGGCHISDVESLLTNPILDFKENTSAIYFYFVNNVLEKVDADSITDVNYRKFYKELLLNLKSIVDAKNADDFIASLMAFSDNFLNKGNDYSKDVLASIKECAKNIDFYIDEHKGTLPFFEKLMLLFEKEASSKKNDVFSSYSVLKKEGDAIRVDDYNSLVFIPSNYHFVLFATADNVKKEIKKYEALSDFEKEKIGIDSDKIDISKELFLFNSGFSQNMSVSYSEQNFTGFALAPSFFDEIHEAIKDDSYISLKQNDPDYSENNLYQNSMNFNKNDISDNSKVLYTNVLKHINDSTSLEYYKSEYSISPTTLKDIEECPFAWSLKSFVDNRLSPEDEKRALNIRAYNKEGEFYHTVIEEFYKKEMAEVLKADIEITSRRDLLSLVYDEVLSSEPYTSAFPERVMVFLKTECKDRFLKILENDILSSLLYKDSEVKLESEIDGIKVKGRLDGLFTTTEGDIMIVDYKRSGSSVPQKASFNIKKYENAEERELPYYQAPFYMMLYSKVNGVNIRSFIYYSFMDGKHLEFPIAPYNGNEYLSNDELIAITRESIKRADDYIKNGVFEATGKKNCKTCGFKSMCRARFM